MTDKTETEILLAEAANCRKLAQMTSDHTAREALERIACKHDERRLELEALRTSGPQVNQPAHELSLDKFAIEEVSLVDDMPPFDGDGMHAA